MTILPKTIKKLGTQTVHQVANPVTVSSGSSNPSNGKFFVPDTLTASIGTTVTWTNDYVTLHTVTSGSPQAGIWYRI